MSKVAVQLLTWNGVEMLPALLTSLASQTFTDFELLVLDNGSHDGSAELVEEAKKTFPRPLRLIKSAKNSGFAAGHNALFAASKAPYLLCLNQDAELSPLYLEKLVAFLDAHPDSGAVSGKILRLGSGNVIDSAGLRLHRTGAVTDFGAGEQDHGQYDGLREVFGISGAIAMYRRTAAAASSADGTLFDASFFAYKEDVDLAWRERLAGFKAYIVNDAVAYHGRSQGAHRRRDPWRESLSIRNHLFVLVKNLPKSEFARLFAVVPYEAAKALYLLFRMPSCLRAYAEAWRLLPEMREKRKVIQSRATAKLDNWFS
jgi:GT2 family glycosyltransferase